MTSPATLPSNPAAAEGQALRLGPEDEFQGISEDLRDLHLLLQASQSAFNGQGCSPGVCMARGPAYPCLPQCADCPTHTSLAASPLISSQN